MRLILARPARRRTIAVALVTLLAACRSAGGPRPAWTRRANGPAAARPAAGLLYGTGVAAPYEAATPEGRRKLADHRGRVSIGYAVELARGCGPAVAARAAQQVAFEERWTSPEGTAYTRAALEIEEHVPPRCAAALLGAGRGAVSQPQRPR